MKLYKWSDFNFEKSDLTDYEKNRLKDMLEKNNPAIEKLIELASDLNKRLDGTVAYLKSDFPAEASSITAQVKRAGQCLKEINNQSSTKTEGE